MDEKNMNVTAGSNSDTAKSEAAPKPEAGQLYSAQCPKCGYSNISKYASVITCMNCRHQYITR